MSAQPFFTETRCARHGWWLLLLLTLLLYLPGTGTLPLMDRDEPKFAHATVEMMDRGSWAVPYFNERYRFDKPPLTYWWMWLHYRCLGVNELSARLHSVISTWLVGWVCMAVAGRISGARAGLLAGGAWLLTLQVLVHGRLCVADMPMVLCVALAMRALLELLLVPKESFGRWHWLLYTSLGLGFLAKGPVAWCIPALALLLQRWVFWRSALPPLHLGKGMLLSLAILGAWGVPALLQTGGQFWQVGMGEHVIQRGASAFNGRWPIPGYYLGTALLSLLPWVLFLPQIVKAVRSHWSMERALMVSWFAAPYLIFSVYATQLPHYVMPGFPAAMVLLVTCGRWPLWSRFSFTVSVLLYFTLQGMDVWAMRSDLPVEMRTLAHHGITLLRTLSVAAALIMLAAYFHWSAWMKRLAAVALLLGFCFNTQRVAEKMRLLHPTLLIAEQLKPLSQDTQLVGWHYHEPSLIYYTDHAWKFTSTLDTARRQLSSSKPHAVVLLRREWTLGYSWRSGAAERDFSTEMDALIQQHESSHSSFTVQGFNAARSSWVELVVLTRLKAVSL